MIFFYLGEFESVIESIYRCRCIPPYMSIKRRKKNGVVYLEQYKSIRIGNKIKSVYVKSLGPENPKAASTKPRVPVLERLEHFPSHRAGDVTILWEIAKENRFVEILDGICCGQAHIEGISPGKLLTAWAINRVVDPTSATKLERWIPQLTFQD